MTQKRNNNLTSLRAAGSLQYDLLLYVEHEVVTLGQLQNINRSLRLVES